MSNLLEFPTADRPITESEIAELHSQAFRDLEGGVCDLDRMGEIANYLIMNCAAREDSYHNLELATFRRLATGEDADRVQGQLSRPLAR
jgi:hypothetical protein